MTLAFLTIGTAFIITFLSLPLLMRVLVIGEILDYPNLFKTHTTIKPTMGGICVFLGLYGSLLFLGESVNVLESHKYLFLAFILIFLIGIREDTVKLKPFQKFFGQIAAAFIIVSVCDIRLMSLYGLFGVQEVPLVISYILSVFTIIVITNAYNLIDGIDGLAGAVGVIASLFFGIWFFLNDQTSFALISFGFAGGLLAFLNFNWAPSKIFMGDTGSLLIGFFLSIVTIKFIDSNYAAQGGLYSFGGSIGTALAILILPLADTARVFVKRVAKGKSPMHPDRTHFHHILLRLGCNHAQSTGVLVTVNVIFVLLALVLKNFSDAIVIPVLLVTAFALGTILELIFKSAIDKRKEELKERNRAQRSETKVVSISKNAG